jgi:uncharacterized protein
MMESKDHPRCTAFEGLRVIASGSLRDVARAACSVTEPVLVFDDITGEMIEIDLRGTAEEVLARLGPEGQADETSRGPGRPKLGVVAREITLLPRHWDWLNGQPGGASVALRKLVEEASRAKVGLDKARASRDAAYKFLSALVGNLPGFEETIRALFAGDAEQFQAHTQAWPADLRGYAFRMAEPAFRA